VLNFYARSNGVNPRKANLARTAVASAFPKGEQERIVTALERGRMIIDQLAGATLTAAGATADLAGATAADFSARVAGRVTYAGLQQIAAVPLAGLDAAQQAIVAIVKEYLEAAGQVALRVGSLFGGAQNMFLDPANALPQEGVAQTQARVLYENLLNPRIVGVFKTAGGGAAAPAAVASRDLVTIHKTAADGILQPNENGTRAQKADARTVQQRNLSAAEKAELVSFATDVAAGGQWAAATADNIEAILQFLEQHPRLSRATTKTALDTWTAQIRQLRDQTVAAPVNVNTPIGAAAVPTVLAVHESNASAARAGFLLASRHNPLRPRDSYSEVAAASDARVSAHVRLVDTPIMKGLIASEVAQGGNKNTRHIGEEGFTGRRRADVGGDLHDLFEDEPVGAMFGSVRGGRDAALGEIGARGEYAPQVNGLGLSSANVRFGTLAYNVDRLSTLAMDELLRVVALIYFGAPWRYETLSGFDAHNILLPCGFLGFRVGQYDMALGIKLKAGGETGYTYFGHSDFMLSDDAAIKVHYGHFTHYGKSVVHRPEHVFIAYDIFPNRCLGGMGVQPYEHKGQYVPADQVFLKDIFYIMVAFAETNFDKVPQKFSSNCF
jgi:hypothetical protein